VVLGLCALVPLVVLAARLGLWMSVWMTRPNTGRNLGLRGRGPRHGDFRGSPLPTSLSSGVGEVNRYGLLCLKRGLAVV
jgi:hypothetical protein